MAMNPTLNCDLKEKIIKASIDLKMRNQTDEEELANEGPIPPLENPSRANATVLSQGTLELHLNEAAGEFDDEPG